ncbi:hypothetical protein K461DRAFT_286226 [Myriangium duriaei CBS 260.36]|uniref:Uncharacterized protein n=1 Tax=Myriangium duriaei CBS 260.36 TaxID=1168546 RepID=A0A9P4MHW9_9PEZI|nr:hypothetical protein K461DRAFT_286226 [Myriangium duriaei CBS 260.36]
MANRKFFPIFFGGMAIYNPNIIPHPTRADLWIVVAQREQAGEEFHHSEQVTCAAGFLNDVLTCTQEPTVLPLEPSINGKCEGDLAYHNFRPGPRDGRVFMTPGGPMIMYGSQSQYSCLGIWTQDLRTLSPELVVESALPQIFRGATEVQRPAPVGPIQKNFFFFFDSMNKAYIHHDIYPKRVFAEINFDGSVGEDIAPAAYAHDEMCLAQYMPSVAKEWESIHQATNSLAITLCQRADPGCQPNDNNTLIMSFMQHKKFHDFHGEYEPYLFLFKQTAPFELYAISRRPIWIAGRGPLTKETHSLLFDFYQKGREIPKGHSEMFYVTSMSWKTHGQKYHGYIDDPLFLNFGIEDTRAGAIDILAGDLVQDLGLCGDMGSSRI